MATKNVNAITAKLLEDCDPGPRRWWRVSLVKNVAKDPIKVELMESQIEGKTALSEPIGFLRTIATPEKVKLAADTLLVMVGDYAKVIGNYNLQDGES